MMEGLQKQPLMADVSLEVNDSSDSNDMYELSTVSYNMHGYNQGIPCLRDLMLNGSKDNDIYMLQEHWLTPSKLDRFNYDCPGYLSYDSSAMGSSVESGPLYGRPFGGVMILVNSKLYKCTRLVTAEEQYVAVIVGNLLLINTYMPCVGSINRQLIYEEVLQKIALCIDDYSHLVVIIGGDFNVDLNENNPASNLHNQFAKEKGLARCGKLFAGPYLSTYQNESLMCHSNIDFFSD